MTQKTHMQVYCRQCWTDIIVEVDLVDDVVDETMFTAVIWNAGWRKATERGYQCPSCAKGDG